MPCFFGWLYVVVKGRGWMSICWQSINRPAGNLARDVSLLGASACPWLRRVAYLGTHCAGTWCVQRAVCSVQCADELSLKRLRLHIPCLLEKELCCHTYPPCTSYLGWPCSLAAWQPGTWLPTL